MPRYGDIEYERWAKGGFLLGLSLLAFGAGGEILGNAFVGSLPAWEHTLFTASEGVGILVGLVSPLLFGIALPLTE
ncbi:hypothetical protein Halru_1639 [Halovivax ruber XH-70]|uniref:Major facilitator superfamily (MFS) profile domain-containing protein n=1 Tax=Halovivax ruber (strain DSM 18193 / JCM 13892 / XH-70) TaxID=797302 RepID=L0IDE1_HALRX|nr:hypothetical protein [Halovivax ruber]AGB16246.1 hypothetical protein Halru_1639 [Halovivax ruber XH-70]